MSYQSRAGRGRFVRRTAGVLAAALPVAAAVAVIRTVDAEADGGFPDYLISEIGTLQPDPNSPPDEPQRYVGDSEATAISENDIVTGSSTFAKYTKTRHVFRWTEDKGMQDLGAETPDTTTNGWGINTAGTVSGSMTLAGGLAFAPIRSLRDGYQYIGNGARGMAWDINDHGYAAGYIQPVKPFNHDTSNRPAYWAPGSLAPTQLERRCPGTSTAKATRSTTPTSSSGQAQSGAAYGADNHAMAWVPGQQAPVILAIRNPDGSVARGSSRALAINNQNPPLIVGYNQLGASTNPKRAFVQRLGGEPDGIGIQGESSIPYSVNDDGEVVGESGGEGFYWSAKTRMRSLNKMIPADDQKDWKVLAALGINNHHWIVGKCIHLGVTIACLLKPGKKDDNPAPGNCDPMNAMNAMSAAAAAAGPTTAPRSGAAVKAMVAAGAAAKGTPGPSSTPSKTPSPTKKPTATPTDPGGDPGMAAAAPAAAARRRRTRRRWPGGARTPAAPAPAAADPARRPRRPRPRRPGPGGGGPGSGGPGGPGPGGGDPARRTGSGGPRRRRPRHRGGGPGGGGPGGGGATPTPCGSGSPSPSCTAGGGKSNGMALNAAGTSMTTGSPKPSPRPSRSPSPTDTPTPKDTPSPTPSPTGSPSSSASPSASKSPSPSTSPSPSGSSTPSPSDKVCASGSPEPSGSPSTGKCPVPKAGGAVNNAAVAYPANGTPSRSTKPRPTPSGTPTPTDSPSPTSSSTPSPTVSPSSSASPSPSGSPSPSPSC